MDSVMKKLGIPAYFLEVYCLEEYYKEKKSLKLSIYVSVTALFLTILNQNLGTEKLVSKISKQFKIRR
jgi:hypothetical protein